ELPLPQSRRAGAQGDETSGAGGLHGGASDATESLQGPLTASPGRGELRWIAHHEIPLPIEAAEHVDRVASLDAEGETVRGGVLARHLEGRRARGDAEPLGGSSARRGHPEAPDEAVGVEHAPPAGELLDAGAQRPLIEIVPRLLSEPERNRPSQAALFELERFERLASREPGRRREAIGLARGRRGPI